VGEAEKETIHYVLMAKNYIDNLSNETPKGMTEKAEQGIWPSYSPFGYRNVVGQNGKESIEPDPDLASGVRQMFEWYATRRHSVREITRMARGEGSHVARLATRCRR